MTLLAYRISRTPDVEKALTKLRARYSLLDEPEIFKFALSDLVNRETIIERDKAIRQSFSHAIEEGAKLGDKVLEDKGIKDKNMSEQEKYDAIFNKPKDNT